MPPRKRKKNKATIDVGPIRLFPVSGRARPDGSKYWKARWTGASGGRTEVILGWLQEPDAIEAAAGLLTSTYKEPINQGQIQTVEQLLRLWGREQKARTDIEPRTKTFYRTAVRRLTRNIGKVTVQRLDVNTLNRYHRNAGIAASTAIGDLGVLRQAWQWGRERNRVPDRTLPTVRIKQKPREERHLSWDEAWAVVNWLWMNAPPHVALAVHVQAASGCRISEASRLELHRPRIRIPPRPRAGGSYRPREWIPAWPGLTPHRPATSSERAG